MKDITPRTMKDVIVPQNDVVRRPRITPEPRTVHAVVVASEGNDRIDENPFFKKSSNTQSHQTPVGHNTERLGTKRTGPHPAIWLLLVIILLGVGFMIANYFSSATIEIEPVTRSAAIDRDFTVVKEGGEEDLTFKFMSLTEEKAKEIPSTIEKKIQKKASGKVIIYNTYNGEKQRLIKNTRLESADHKIFRIDESVVVPGAKIANGKVSQPGAVEAIVYADVPGKEYNIGLGDFTIPGFKGDPRYDKFTARSKADSPIGGGFSGTVNVPSDEAVLAAQEELKQELKKISIEKVRAQIPDGVSFFPGSMVLKFEEVPQEFTSEDTANISMKATVSVFFFDTELFVKKLATLAIPEYQQDSFTIPALSTLAFTFLDPVDNVVLSDLTKIRFHLSGNAIFVGKIDTENIRTILAGKDKKDFGKIVVGERNVGKAEAVIRPMWKTVFPSDPKKITIKITASEQ